MPTTLGGWELEARGGLLVASCALLAQLPHVRHAFSTRRAEEGDGAPAEYDLGGAEPTPQIERRRLRLARAAGLPASRPLAPRQVHGRAIVCLDRSDDDDSARGAVPEADGVILLAPHARRRIASVRTADCVPLLLTDAGERAAAALHAGWRGIAAGIVDAALAELERRGIEGGSLRVALGPAIGPCCYEVGEDVRAEMERALGREARSLFRDRGAGRRPALDLHAALGLQLARAGVRPELVSAAPWCTACRGDLFFSHRRDAGRAGRMMAVVGWAA